MFIKFIYVCLLKSWNITMLYKYFIVEKLHYGNMNVNKILFQKRVNENFWDQILKGIVYTNEHSVINYSPSCRSKPIKPSFIFRTQIKIVLMKSESSLTLCRQQWSLHDQGPET